MFFSTGTVTIPIQTRLQSLRYVFCVFFNQNQQQASGNSTYALTNRLALGSSQVTEIQSLQLQINGNNRWPQPLLTGRDALLQLRMLMPWIVTSGWALSESAWNSTQFCFAANFSSEYDAKVKSGTDTSKANAAASLNIVFSGSPTYSPLLQIYTFVVYDSQIRMDSSGNVYVDQ